MLASEYDPFGVYSTVVNNAFTALGPYTLSVSMPNLRLSLLGFDTTANLKTSGVLCDTTTSCL